MWIYQSEGSVFAPSGAGKPEARKTPLEIMFIHLDHVVRRLCIGLFVGVCLEHSGLAQRSFTWQEVRDKFKATNPTLRALEIGIDESKAQEITAYLRPNPEFSLTADGLHRIVASRRQRVPAIQAECAERIVRRLSAHRHTARCRRADS